AREDPRDCFVSNLSASLEALPSRSIVGTSSLRREAQLRERHPGLQVKPLRGNLDTRLAKLDRGEFQAVVLAAAGLKRLGLAARIRAAGADPILFPTIEILPPENAAAVSSLIARLDGFQLAIFISPTAVMRGHAMVVASRKWPAGLRVAAVGTGTASALEELGFHSVIAPSGEADSEALAELPELQDLKGCSGVIFRGQGGREWLRTRRETQGARVEYAECYRRARPDADAGGLLARWQSGGIEAVSITSAEGLANFFEML